MKVAFVMWHCLPGNHLLIRLGGKERNESSKWNCCSPFYIIIRNLEAKTMPGSKHLRFFFKNPCVFSLDEMICIVKALVYKLTSKERQTLQLPFLPGGFQGLRIKKEARDDCNWHQEVLAVAVEQHHGHDDLSL